ncbi:MAG: sugar phosphate isomerase/epimerase [Planctomycetes bacterium]|nr:sugar phosphate isomerase/epimerase [Planctomycetota bacterium]MCB9905146.1 sugar phosphate isomerase/epimerase [Planctomycetota bacterium]
MYLVGYNTNGLAHHRLEDAFALLADLGYQAVAITPDVGQLDPYRLRPGEVEGLRRRADDLGLALALETGSRFLIDPRVKHGPSLLAEDADAREPRRDFLRRCVDLAAELGAEVVSTWAGAAPGGEVGDAREARVPAERIEALWTRLVEELLPICDYAAERGRRLGFEPEPGMFVERPAGFVELRRRLAGRAPALGLTLDVGHLLCTGDLPVGAAIRAAAPELVHVHLADISEGVHQHLPFGCGDLDLRETLNALESVGYGGIAAVELSRDSHRGAQSAAEALAQLRHHGLTGA